MKEPFKEVDKNAVSLVRTNSHCKEGLVVEISMTVSIFLFLSHCMLDIFATEKHVSHRDEYGLGAPKKLQSLFFMDLKKPLNWLKSKDRRKLNETVKHPK